MAGEPSGTIPSECRSGAGYIQLFHEYRSNAGIKRFDLAIRFGGRLLGLCYGLPSASRLILRIHAGGRAPLENPLRGSFFRVVLFAASAYASLLGSKEIWLMLPVNERVAEYYSRFGFSAERNRGGTVTHMIMRVDE